MGAGIELAFYKAYTRKLEKLIEAYCPTPIRLSLHSLWIDAVEETLTKLERRKERENHKTRY